MPRGFQFRLARVLRVRELFEETARAELGIAIAAANEAAAYVEHLRSEVVAARESLAELQTKPSIDPGSLIAKDKCVVSLLMALRPAKTRHSQLLFASEKAKAIWMTKKAEAQALDKLSVRHRDKHREEVNIKENAEQDEVAISRAFAKSAAETLEEKSRKARTSPFREIATSHDSQ